MKYNFVQGTCDTKWCPNERRVKSPFCSACAAAHHRAEVKGALWAIQRQDTLSKWQSRIVYLGTEKNKKEMGNAARYVQKHRK